MHWEWGSYFIWHRYRKQVILVPSLFSPWTRSNLLGRAHVYSEDFNRWFWDLIRHSEQRGEWVCLSLATCGSINIVSKNVENGSLNGEAERCSLVLGYCTNHRATPVSGEKATTQDSALFLEERGECRFRKAEVAGCPSEGRHFSAVLTTAVWPGEWWDLLFSSVSFYVMAPQGIFFFLRVGPWFPFKALRKSQCCSAQHCGISDWHLLFVSLCLSSTSDKGSFLLSVGCCEKSRLSDAQILQCSWSGAVFITIVDGRGCTISNIFWSTWHIVLWSPEDWESGKMLPYLISGSKWLYQK